MTTDHLSRYFNPTNDVAFKKLFQDKNKLVDLLNNLLKLKEGKKIVELTYLPNEGKPLYVGGRQTIFDLKVKDEAGHYYIVEMQRKREKSYLNRVQFYGSQTFVAQLDEAMDYDALLPVVVISILGTKIFGDDIPYISYHRCLEDSTQQNLLLATTYVFVELGKFDGNNIQNDADAWLHLFKCATFEDSPPEEIHNENIIKAYRELEKYKWTKAEYDEYIRASLAAAGEEDRLTDGLEEKFEEGLEKGMAVGIEKGMEKGLEKGMEMGMEKGLQEGEKKANLETAKRMMEKGLGDKMILEVSNISPEDLQNLKNL